MAKRNGLATARTTCGNQLTGPAASHGPLSDYALVGNTHSAALVGRDGSIDWFCLPNFDSGAVFCRLLDLQHGGYFQIVPAGRYLSARRYRDGSAVLETEFECVRGGRARLTDFMPSPPLTNGKKGPDKSQYRQLLRRIDGLSGEVQMEVIFRPTFDFARHPARLTRVDEGVKASASGECLLLHATPPIDFVIDGDTARSRLQLREGDVIWLVLSDESHDAPANAEAPHDPERQLQETLRHWHDWESLCTYDGPYEPLVRQSARVLKLLTFGPTGALVAAPTSSLPEAVGGPHNWDYRFCWLRDSALVLNSLMALGYQQSARQFFHWLDRLCADECEQRLQIMYRLDGGRELPEIELHHLSGYRDSRPVRIGNGAAKQEQLDVFGHILDAAWIYTERMQEPVSPGLAHVLRHLADQAATRWSEPDQGLWETRGPPQHFVSSKLMCWVALDRALRLAAAGKLQGDTRKWRRERTLLRRAILEKGFDAASGVFTQAFGSKVLDASLLLLPLMHFIPARDPRMRATVERIRERLMAHGLVYRYLDDDGLSGGEASFALCSFWLVDNLALQGRVAAARELFEHVVSFGNDLGLFAEEIDPVNRQLLGNYPQGYTHLGLIKSALTIAAAERGGR